MKRGSARQPRAASRSTLIHPLSAPAPPSAAPPPSSRDTRGLPSAGIYREVVGRAGPDMAEGRVFVGWHGRREAVGAPLAGHRSLWKGYPGPGARCITCLASLPFIAFRGSPGRGFSAPFLWQRPSRRLSSFLPPPTPLIPVGLERERGPVLGANAPAGLEKAVEEAYASDAGTGREVPLSLGNRNCCLGRSCIRKGASFCLRKGLGLFHGRGREESGLQLDDGLLGRAL